MDDVFRQPNPRRTPRLRFTSAVGDRRSSLDSAVCARASSAFGVFHLDRLQLTPTAIFIRHKLRFVLLQQGAAASRFADAFWCGARGAGLTLFWRIAPSSPAKLQGSSSVQTFLPLPAFLVIPPF